MVRNTLKNTQKTKPIIIGTVYRPSTQSDFMDNFIDCLSHVRSDLEWFILGEFNIDLPKKTSLWSCYKSVLEMFDLKQVIDQATCNCQYLYSSRPYFIQ